MGQFITPDVLPEDTFCRVLLIPNDPKWIGAVSGALLPMIYASEWQQYEGITPEEAADRSKLMLNQFWESNGCEIAMSKCCEPLIVKNRIDPDTGRPQVSYDGGETWKTDPADVENQITLLQPPVRSGSPSTKCDAASNAAEHIDELITATGENLSTASTVFALAVGIAEAVLALFLIIVSAGTLAAPVTAVATAIWVAATQLFELGIDGYNAYWTTDKQDAIFCAIYCNIGDNGQFTEAQYQAFRTKIKAQLPASPAFDIVMTAINAGGATGLSQMASYGTAAMRDCDSCDCDEFIRVYVVDTGGTEISYVDNKLTASSVSAGGSGNLLYLAFEPGALYANINECGNLYVEDGGGALFGTYTLCGTSTAIGAGITVPQSVCANTLVFSSPDPFTMVVYGKPCTP